MADESPRSTRRALLRATAALSAGVGLAGCNQTSETPTPDPATAAPVPGTPTEGTETPTDVPGEGDLVGPWPTARSGPRNHGRSAEVGPEGTPAAHWRATVGLRTSLRAAVGPDGPVVTRDDGLVRAYDVEGAVRWETRHDEGFVAAPVVAPDGTTVLPGYEGTVVARNPDGSERWRMEIPEGLFAPNRNDATPLRVAGETVILAHPRGRVYALSLADGSERWAVETFRRPHRPAVADGAAFVAGDDRELEGGVTLALSLDDGSERWRRREDGSARVGVGLHDGGVVTTGIEGGVVVRETDDGSERWRRTIDGEPWVSTVPRSVAGRVWVGTLDEGLHALDADGVERFDLPVGATPAVGDGRLYVATSTDGTDGRYRGAVVAVDGEGVERWRTTTRGPPEGHLRYRDGRVVFGTLTGVVGSLGAGGGRAWRAFARRETLPEPVVGPRAVYCGEYRSYVGGFRYTDGTSHLWGLGFEGAAPGTPAVTDRGVLAGSELGETALMPRLPEGVAERPGGRLTVTPTPRPDATPTAHVDRFPPDPRWRWTLDGPVGSVGVGYRVAFVGVGTRVVAIDPNGEERWQTDLGEPVRAVPAVDTSIYASTTRGGLVSISRGNGSERWATRVGQRATAPVLVERGGPVLVGTDRGLVSVDSGGTVQWRVGEERVYGAPALGGSAVFADAGGVVRSVSLDGEVNWRAELGAPIHGAPALGPERVYVGDRDGYLNALSKRDGTPAWHYEVGEWVDGSPVLAHGAVFVVDAAGGLTCVVGE